ncbi:hypothetical protein FOHLNKBM_3632 [Methylobacterium longum]|uniref:Uncharacterized protein n=2 Tax=Methylobacterium longum TaxID=767694 RepID=A0ABT8APQ0_9HYPH|nr:hypothetical protein [Methylobacterium longum]GJE12582.1 hypothetical protein FOHLNKBM_3632 [Methylobacterium longum]
MTRKLWSLNALSTEMSYDRRTVALALKNIRPDGQLAGHPAWFLDTALNVLKVKPKPVEESFDPKWPDAYKVNAEKCDNFPAGCVVMGVMDMVYRAPALAGVFAVEAGAYPATAYRMKQYLSVALMMAAQDALKRLGVEPFSKGEQMRWSEKEFDECNWPHLASKAGVPCDVEGWRAAMLEKNKAEAQAAA